MRTEYRYVGDKPKGALQDGAAKALVQGLGFRDYTHWRRLDDTDCSPVFELELGYGTAVRSEPSPRIPLSRTDVTLTCEGEGFSLSVSADRAEVYNDAVVICNGCDRAEIVLPKGRDWRGYAERFHERMLRRGTQGIPFGFMDETRPTDIVVRRGGYRGVQSPCQGVSFDEGFVRTLIVATTLQRFDGLLPDYSIRDGPLVGPFDFSFGGMERARHCSDIHTYVGGIIGLLSFSVYGVLTSDGRGIVFKGERSELVLEADISMPMDVDRRYLGSHPVPTWSFDDDDR